MKTIRAQLVYQTWEYEPIGRTLERRLDEIARLGVQVINVIETKVHPSPGGTDQAFIILYRDEVQDS